MRIEDSPPDPTNALGDWYANLLNVGSQRWVLCVNERSLLPLLIRAKADAFPGAFPDTLSAVLERIGVPAPLAAREVEHCREWRFAKTRSRSVLGSMTDFAFQFDFLLRRGAQPLEAMLALAEMPCMPLELTFPDRTARSLLGCDEPEPRRRRSV